MKNTLEWVILILSIAVCYIHPPLPPVWSILTSASLILYFIFSPLDWIFTASADAKQPPDQKSSDVAKT